MRTNVYVDGFNLFYRALKGTPFKWLDLRKLAETVFPEADVHRIGYFTAPLDARPHNPTQPQRQQVYLRALATLPCLAIHYGVFRSGKEKRSDVNLATRLLVDGFKNEYEQAVIVSNDRDFAGAEPHASNTCGPQQPRAPCPPPSGRLPSP